MGGLQNPSEAMLFMLSKYDAINKENLMLRLIRVLFIQSFI